MLRSLNLVVRDAPLECPFHSVKKRVGWDLVANAFSGLAQGYMNWDATTDANQTNRFIAKQNAELQRETNAQNKQIADEANALNYKMFQEQNAWNLEQWNRQNEYNSPAHMVQMYKNAGLNPAMLAGQFPAASQLNSADAKAAQTAYATAPQLNYHAEPAYFTGFDGVSSAINAYFQNQLIDSQKRKTDQESSGQSILNDQMIRKMPYELKKLQEESKKEGVLGDIARSELQYRMKTLDTRINMLYGDAAIQQKSMKLMDEQLSGQILDNQMKKIMNAFQPQWNNMQLRQASLGLQQIRANIGLINANTLLTQAQKESEIEKKVGYVIDNEMKGIDKETKEQMKPLLIQSAREDLYSKEDARYWRPFEHNYQMQGKVGQYFNMPSGQYGAASMFERNQKRDRLK